MCLTPPAEGFPWDDQREIFSGCQRMAKVPNAVEILRKIWTAWVWRTSVTDKQTTDGRAIAYSEREREFTFAKNWASAATANVATASEMQFDDLHLWFR